MKTKKEIEDRLKLNQILQKDKIKGSINVFYSGIQDALEWVLE